MSNVIEVDLDDDAVEVTNNQELPNEPDGPFKIAVVGDDADLAQACTVLYSSVRTEIRVLKIDEVKDFNPHVSMVCADITLSKNDLQEDAEFLDIIKKLSYLDTGICIKSTISPETLNRVFSCMPNDAANGRIIYSPELGTSFNEIVGSQIGFLGGSPKVIEQHENILKNLTIDSRPKVLKGGVFDICLTRLAVAGRRAVLQEYYNQLYSFVNDHDMTAFGAVRNMLNQISDNEHLYSVPVSLRALAQSPELSKKESFAVKGEFENRSVRALVGVTDKMLLVEEAINTKNLR
jgi:hypothetical protein